MLLRSILRCLIEVFIHRCCREDVSHKKIKKVMMIKCTAGSGLLEVGDPQHGRAKGATALLEFCSGN